MAKHAILSASSSERWIRCPPSARLCENIPDPGSPYAQEGTDAHALCEYLLLQALGHNARDPTEGLAWYNAEMQDAAEGYAAFVMEQVETARQTGSEPLVCVEQRVDYSRWVPEGFGTADALVISDGLMQIIDFKYGTGVPVSAAGEDGRGNSQLKCYALGALDTFGNLYDIERIRLTIYQPRRENFDTFEMTKDELLEWAEKTLRPRAELAWKGKGEFAAGDHCRFCRIRSTCRKRAEESMRLAAMDFTDPPSLSNEEIAALLPKIEQMESWASDVKDYALKKAIEGNHFPGWKLVEGRSNRYFPDEDAVARIVSEAGYEPYEQKLLGVTAMT